MSFSGIAREISDLSGRPIAFGLAVAVILAWAAMGPLFGWSDTWQLVVNTGTTIVNFLMCFVIQSTQNHDTAAIKIMIAELIRAQAGAQNALVSLEDLDDAQLRALADRYAALAQAARTRLGPR